MTYQPYQYHIYKLEHGLSAAEQRAADQRLGELAADVADLRCLVGNSLGRVASAVARAARLGRTRKEAHFVPVPAER